jgi:hypothetical protein
VNQTPRPTRQANATAATGDHAPASGWWRPDEAPQPFRYLQQGDIMPSLGGSPTLWTLVQELQPSRRVQTPSLGLQGLRRTFEEVGQDDGIV